MVPRGRPIPVVDDDPSIRSFLALALSDEGYAVDTARDGAQALAKARSRPPAAIVLHLNMPILDGWGFIKAWRAQPVEHSAPVLVMSADYRAPRPDALGVAGFIAKPFDLDTLLGMIEALLSR